MKEAVDHAAEELGNTIQFHILIVKQ